MKTNYVGKEIYLPDFRIMVKGKNGWSPVKVYQDDQSRNWIEARDGTHFALEFRNSGVKRLLAVSSVDGLNIITGERARVENKGGYVINRGSSVFIEGWRTGADTVRDFVFTNKKQDAYAAKVSGDSSNVGVIGVNFFREIEEMTYLSGTSYWYGKPNIRGMSTNTIDYNQGQHLYNSTITTNSVSSSLDSFELERSPRVMCKKSFSMGTEMGNERKSESVSVSYKFEETPSFDFVIYYDSKENLIANGILKKENKLPQPFENTGYCKVV